MQMIVDQSIFYDLVVTGFHSHFGADTHGKPIPVHDLIGATITPFLVVPNSNQQLRNVLICFDGSFPSMRSLQDFAAIATDSDFEITILTADKPQAEAAFLLKRASDYLQSYAVTNCRTVAEPGSIRDVVRDHYCEKSDLIVVGAHSRHAVRDFFVGSLVTDLLKKADTAVLLSQ